MVEYKSLFCKQVDYIMVQIVNHISKENLRGYRKWLFFSYCCVWHVMLWFCSLFYIIKLYLFHSNINNRIFFLIIFLWIFNWISIVCSFFNHIDCALSSMHWSAHIVLFWTFVDHFFSFYNFSTRDHFKSAIVFLWFLFFAIVYIFVSTINQSY